MFEQDRMLMRLQQRVQGMPELLVCFLAGSHGRRTADDFSDLDVVLVYATAAERDAAWRQRRDFARSIMPYVAARSFDAEHIRPFFHIALYANGSKVDFLFETADSLQPNPWHQEIRLLKDTDGRGAHYQAACARALMPQPRITAAELAALDNRFWVMFWDTLRILLRGDDQKPFTIYLELLHFTLPPLLRLLPPEDPAHRALLHASYGQDTRATVRHLRQLLAAYLAARTAVMQRLDLHLDLDRGFERSIQSLIDKHA